MILCDENLSYRLIKKVEHEFEFPGIKHVTELGLGPSPEDERIFLTARRIGLPRLATNDLDFLTLIKRLGAPPKLILLRTGNLATGRLAELLISRKKRILEFLAEPDRYVFELKLTFSR
ncbi:DUF5615 family PIN-like protein [Lewinella sp. IMCC34191]|uniref:DUF5615 family PIN-like protein n=1 Tax=Lewinella sp. IMCC34191 TaxID=2259172 RepID=UPI000E2536CA|nr:DUF5615 family PIN-like protein [Lewinella sp. IMCC34191]